jgi:hypothetical protein
MQSLISLVMLRLIFHSCYLRFSANFIFCSEKMQLIQEISLPRFRDVSYVIEFCINLCIEHYHERREASDQRNKENQSSETYVPSWRPLWEANTSWLLQECTLIVTDFFALPSQAWQKLMWLLIRKLQNNIKSICYRSKHINFRCMCNRKKFQVRYE